MSEPNIIKERSLMTKKNKKNRHFSSLNAQEWLDSNYPKEKRAEITCLDISHQNLTGSLNLNDFINLEELVCLRNCLTNLIINNCRKLKRIDCSNNQLTNLRFLSNLVNLESLDIYRNPFFGSLETLNRLKNLKVLDIMNTEIDNGLEYLPNSLETLFCGNTPLTFSKKFIP